MAREAANRPRRAPVDGHRSKLSVRGKDPAYEYFIATDKDGRIADLQDQGWEIVDDKSVTIGDRRITRPDAEGSPRTVDVGNGETGFLMRIKREWWDEDRARKQKVAAEAVGALKAQAQEFTDGISNAKFSITRE
jgi:hypothetical protein